MWRLDAGGQPEPSVLVRGAALRALFTADLTEQEAKFADKLTEIVRAMPRLGEFLAHTRALGARHVGYGVRAPDYLNVGAAVDTPGMGPRL